jgi:hypothetical protein
MLPVPHQDVLVRIGVALLQIQTAEKVIKLCMTFVLQKTSPLTLEALEAQQESERRSTLGYFLNELKKRADVHPDFAEVLASFLAMRNTFVHNLTDVPGWDMNTDEGSARAREFLNELLRVADHVLKVFIGLVRAWQREVGFDDALDHGYLKEIDASYTWLAAQIFSPQGKPPGSAGVTVEV